MSTDLIRTEPDKCPQCNKMPRLGYSDRYKSFDITCEDHGHEAMGPTVERAVMHWNRYIGFIRRQAYSRIADSKMSKANESFCIHCEKYTGTRIIENKKEYKAECKGCGLLKFKKEIL